MYLPLASDLEFDECVFEIDIPFVSGETKSISEDEMITLTSTMQSSSVYGQNTSFSDRKINKRKFRKTKICFVPLDEKSLSHDVTFLSKKKKLDFKANYEDDECSIISLKMGKFPKNSKKSVFSVLDDKVSCFIDDTSKDCDFSELKNDSINAKINNSPKFFCKNTSQEINDN